MDPFICFYQLLDKTLTIIIVFNLITGEGHFGPPLYYCLEVYLGSSLCILGNFPSARVLANLIMVPSIKIFHSLSPNLNFFIPHVLLPTSLPSFHLSFHSPLPSHVPKLFISCLFPLPRQIHVWISKGPLCYLASLELWTIVWLSFALCLISTYEREHTIFVLLCLGYFTQESFFSISIHLPANFKMSLFNA